MIYIMLWEKKIVLYVYEKKNGGVYTLYTTGKKDMYICYIQVKKSIPHRNFLGMRLAMLLSRR